MAKKPSSSGHRTKLNSGELRGIKRRYEQFKFDTLQMYMGYPYILKSADTDATIEIKSPTLGDIIKIGQDRFYAGINPFVTNTTQYKLPLWKANKDWNVMSDFELFITFVSARNLDEEVLSLVFGENVDWNAFTPYMEQIEGKDTYYLISEEFNYKMDENVYQHMTQYLHMLLNIFPEEKVTKDPALKQLFIKTEERKLKNAEAKEKKENFSLQPLISACVNHPGFKYKTSELRELSLYEFYDSVHRLQVYETTTALLSGMYSGFCDTSKIPQEQFNWMRELN